MTREGTTTPPRVPRVVTALDVLAAILLVLTLRSMFGEGYRITLPGDFRLSLRSWERVALWFAAVLVLRHLLWRVIPWHRRVRSWAVRVWRSDALRAAWGPFLASRLLVAGAGYIALQTIGFEEGPPFRALRSDLLDLYARWDAGWYFGIASTGYDSHFNPARANSVAFFPGFPLLMRIAGEVLDLNLWHAGILVVVVSFLAGLAYLYRLARLDLPPDQARAALLFLAFYPFAVCYSAILTEALFLCAAAAAFYHFRQSHWWRAAVFSLFLGLLRPNGFLLCVPFGLLAVLPFARSRGWWFGGRSAPEISWRQLAIALAVAALPVAGMLLYAAHLNTAFGRPFAFVEAQQAWGRTTFGGVDTLRARWDMIEAQGFAAYAQAYTVEILEAAAAFFALAAVVPIIRRFGLAYGVFVAMAVLPPLVSMGSVSLGRYTAPLFPIFLWLGAAVPERHRQYWLVLFAAGEAVVAMLFFTWRAPY